MKNAELKAVLRVRGVTHWQLAEAMGISPYTLSVWLRRDLDEDRLARVKAGLEAIIQKEERNNARSDK